MSSAWRKWGTPLALGIALACVASDAAMAQFYFRPFVHTFRYDLPPPPDIDDDYDDAPRFASRRAVARILAREGFQLVGPLGRRGDQVVATGVSRREGETRFFIDPFEGVIIHAVSLGGPPPRRDDGFVPQLGGSHPVVKEIGRDRAQPPEEARGNERIRRVERPAPQEPTALPRREAARPTPQINAPAPKPPAVKSVETANPAERPKPVEWAKPSEIVKPVEASEAPKPAQPPKAAEAPKPMDATKPVAAKPIEPAKPVKAVKSAEPPKPVEWAKPSEISKPAEAAEAPKPAQPPKAAEAAKPMDATKPVAAKPIEPAKPVKAVKAVEPQKPVESVTPVQTSKAPEPPKATEGPKPVAAAKSIEPAKPVAAKLTESPKPAEAAKTVAARPVEPPKPHEAAKAPAAAPAIEWKNPVEAKAPAPRAARSTGGTHRAIVPPASAEGVTAVTPSTPGVSTAHASPGGRTPQSVAMPKEQ